MEPKYILIVGTGRSGTHWLCKLLDISPQTFCRNEAHRPETSPMAKLPSPYICHPLGDDFGEQFERAIAASTLRISEREQSRWQKVGDYPKFYLHEFVRTSGINTILGFFRRRRVRAVLSRVMPGMWPPDWPMPWWLANRTKLKDATKVFQLPNIPGWATWILDERPDILIIHIVRHPGGFLKSWRSRYLDKRNEDKVEQDNEKTLRRIAELEPEWAARFGDIDAMSIDESKLWYWCYLNEKIYSAGRGKPNYVQVIFEDLAADSVKIAETLYTACNLPWTDSVKAEVAKNASNSKSIATAWRSKLSPEQIELVERCLASSFMRDWWSDQNASELLSSTHSQ